MSKLFDVETTTTKNVTNEWYTPARYIEAARQVMDGGIDLDPASCAVANETVKAARYYTQEEDGLSKVWQGRVWLNPPYSPDRSKASDKRSLIAQWIKKLIAEYECGNVEQAILLCPCYAEGSWFQPLWAYLICFADHKLHFYKPKNGRIQRDSQHGHVYGTIFAYLGPNEAKFIEVFSQYGHVAKCVNPRSQPKLQPDLWSQEVSA